MTPQQVLVVDSDDKLLRLVEATLALSLIEPVTAESAEQALHALRSHGPDLVISEGKLPDLDGVALLQRVRSMPGLDAVPFLFFSARDDAEVASRKLGLSGVHFLRKPFSIDELLSTVLALLEEPRRGPPAGSEFSGTLETTAVPDVLRMLVVQRQTGTLTVRPRATAAEAIVTARDGHVIAAEFGLLTGVEALFALLLYDEGDFGFAEGPVDRPTTIHESTLPLLMEGYRLLDEGLLRRIDPREPPAARMFEHLIDSHRQATPLVQTSAVSLPSGRTEVDLASIEEDFDDVGVDTADFAPAFLTAELEAIEAELELEFDEPAHTIGTIVVEAEADEDVTDVALVDDTMADIDVVTALGFRPSGADTLDVMDFYEMVKAAVVEELGASSVQLGTRTGRVITSNIPEVVRRDTVAAFSREAIQFASKDPDGTQFASLDAGDLHVLVVEVDHLRLLTLLFDSRPDPLDVLKLLKPHMEDYRATR